MILKNDLTNLGKRVICTGNFSQSGYPGILVALGEINISDYLWLVALEKGSPHFDRVRLIRDILNQPQYILLNTLPQIGAYLDYFGYWCHEGCLTALESKSIGSHVPNINSNRNEFYLDRLNEAKKYIIENGETIASQDRIGGLRYL